MKGFLSPLSERVQYVDSFSKICDIEYTILLSRMNSYFDNSRSDRGHRLPVGGRTDRKSTRLNSSHSQISYAVFCLKKKKPTSIRWSRFLTSETYYDHPTSYDEHQRIEPDAV